MRRQNKNYKIGIGIIIGVILTSTVAYAQAVLGASSVSYNNSSSKLSSTTVQGAIDEIYNNAKGGNITYNNTNIVGAYLYDPDKCTTGDEATCRKTACPNNTSKNNCPSGTIIKYKVNENTTKTFHVLHDDISTLTLQQNENTVASTAWYSATQDNSKGPTTALEALENATSGWNNVNTQTYTMGTTNFNGTNEYTGCSYSANNVNCTTNTYTLGERSGKARMITLQEANVAGCIYKDNSCPSWVITDGVYWTMSAYSPVSHTAWIMNPSYGYLDGYYTTSTVGARAVVVISK